MHPAEPNEPTLTFALPPSATETPPAGVQSVEFENTPHPARSMLVTPPPPWILMALGASLAPPALLPNANRQFPLLLSPPITAVALAQFEMVGKYMLEKIADCGREMLTVIAGRVSKVVGVAVTLA